MRKEIDFEHVEGYSFVVDANDGRKNDSATVNVTLININGKIRVQGVSYGRAPGLGWVDFDFNVPPCCQAAKPLLPNSPQPRQIWQVVEHPKSKSTQPRCTTR